MRILLVGGGSGGHVTPLRAISSHILNDTAIMLSVITDRGFVSQTRQLFEDFPEITVKPIFAGKFRRYHSKSFIWHIIHLPTLLKNLRDILYVVFGFMQSLRYFILHKPDVVFCKGGFVCIPVGLVARLFNVKLVIHDSDTRPGLTNKILSRWACVIATGMPVSFYPYPKAKMRYVGMPVDTSYQIVSKKQQSQYKAKLGFSADQKIVLITGGGNGSVPLNTIVMSAAEELLAAGWGIIHLAGKDKSAAVVKARELLSNSDQTNWQIAEFTDMVPRMLAADVVVARTSATTLQECANTQKVVIGVPSPHLLDQGMNAQYFASKGAITALDESSLTGDDLATLVGKTVSDTKYQKQAKKLHSYFAKPKAAEQLARMLVKQQ